MVSLFGGWVEAANKSSVDDIYDNTIYYFENEGYNIFEELSDSVNCQIGLQDFQNFEEKLGYNFYSEDFWNVVADYMNENSEDYFNKF